eukprot:TRINITY_DN13402_c0_g1_i1.p1 TRINITY_DN13402_c0_g1~~TRINITY_DN13402_c0_g1_i1.p1  ORF type:complete len:278 (+),score=58.24 TRINITY_DN13402_c0_g1_i1:167-1000(+)
MCIRDSIIAVEEILQQLGTNPHYAQSTQQDCKSNQVENEEENVSSIKDEYISNDKKQQNALQKKSLKEKEENQSNPKINLPDFVDTDNKNNQLYRNIEKLIVADYYGIDFETHYYHRAVGESIHATDKDIKQIILQKELATESKLKKFLKFNLQNIPLYSNNVLSEWISFTLTDYKLIINCIPQYYHYGNYVIQIIDNSDYIVKEYRFNLKNTQQLEKSQEQAYLHLNYISSSSNYSTQSKSVDAKYSSNTAKSKNISDISMVKQQIPQPKLKQEQN